MQVDGALRVDDALRRSDGTGGVAHRRAFGLRDLRPVERRRPAVQELLVGVDRDAVGDVLLGVAEQVALGVDDDDGAHPRGLLQHRPEHGGHAGIDDQHLVVRVPDDVRDLVRHQLLVHRLEHRAHRRDREEGLQVLRAVPHERADALIPVDPQLVAQPVGQRGGAGADGRERRDLRPRRTPRGDRRRAVDRAAVLEDPRDGQRDLLHRAAHAPQPIARPDTRPGCCRGPRPGLPCDGYGRPVGACHGTGTGPRAGWRIRWRQCPGRTSPHTPHAHPGPCSGRDQPADSAVHAPQQHRTVTGAPASHAGTGMLACGGARPPGGDRRMRIRRGRHEAGRRMKGIP